MLSPPSTTSSCPTRISPICNQRSSMTTSFLRASTFRMSSLTRSYSPPGISMGDLLVSSRNGRTTTRTSTPEITRITNLHWTRWRWLRLPSLFTSIPLRRMASITPLATTSLSLPPCLQLCMRSTSWKRTKMISEYWMSEVLVCFLRPLIRRPPWWTGSKDFLRCSSLQRSTQWRTKRPI